MHTCVCARIILAMLTRYCLPYRNMLGPSTALNASRWKKTWRLTSWSRRNRTCRGYFWACDGQFFVILKGLMVINGDLMWPHWNHMVSTGKFPNILYLNMQYNSLGGWRLPEIHAIPCGTAIRCVVSARAFCKLWAYPQQWYSRVWLHFCACLKRCQNHLEPCLKHILRNLQCFKPWTKTETNRKTLKEPPKKKQNIFF